MFAWMGYQEDILFDELNEFDSILDELDKFKSFSTQITGRKYQTVSTEEVFSQQDHLIGGQKMLLKSILDKHAVLFDGKLDYQSKDKVHLELIGNFKLPWKRVYPVLFTKGKV